MAGFLQIALVALLVAVVSGQDAAFQQGLSVHNQQIQEHARQEQEQQRQVHQFSASLPQQYQQYQQQQYQHTNALPTQYQGPAQEDDGQYRPEYNNPNYFASRSVQTNPEADYQAGIQAHQQQIQEHLRKEASFQPQAYHNNQIDPAYQQGLALHQRQIQEHLAKEQQQPQAQHSQAYYQPAPVQQAYNNPPPASHNVDQTYQQGIQLHQQQLQEHQRQEQEQQRQLGYQQPQQAYRNSNQGSFFGNFGGGRF
jgi:hypothetical protein